MDDTCAWCRFEGRTVRTFAYTVSETGVGKPWHWCPWHQKEVPPASTSDIKETIPLSATSFSDLRGNFNEVRRSGLSRSRD